MQVTEPLLMLDPERSVLVLQAIRSLGVTSRITEFGAQYVTLAYLKRFSVDGMTLEPDVLSTVDSDPDSVRSSPPSSASVMCSSPMFGRPVSVRRSNVPGW